MLSVSNSQVTKHKQQKNRYDSKRTSMHLLPFWLKLKLEASPLFLGPPPSLNTSKGGGLVQNELF